MKYPKPPQIKTSTDYRMFKNVKHNRKIDHNNLKKLLEQTKKKFELDKFPILIDKDGNVIDGQHRLAVAKKLKAPVYYIQSAGLDSSVSTIHSFNKAGKRHTSTDKLEMLYRAGHPEIKKVYKVYKEFEEQFDLVTVARLMANSPTALRNELDQNRFRAVNIEGARDLLGALIESGIPKATKGTVVQCFNYISKKFSIHPAELVDGVVKNIQLWDNPMGREFINKTIVKCYNHRRGEKNRIAVL